MIIQSYFHSVAAAEAVTWSRTLKRFRRKMLTSEKKGIRLPPLWQTGGNSL
jgi:hypothetical protein